MTIDHLFTLIAVFLLLHVFFFWKIYTTGDKWVWGINLQFEPCGCKHIDIVLGLFYLRFDFGKCRRL